MNMLADDFPNWVLWTWVLLTALSVAYVTYDLFTNTPEMKVMKWGWILVTLYLGPVAAFVYWFSCREPEPGTHERFVAPLWKQTVGSTIHCLAGDATGIIVAAIITSLLRLPMGIDVWVEYLVGFAFGLFIFQALFMKDMLGGSYAQAVKQSLLPEWVSMNAVMGGMIPVMVILMSRDMRAMEPTSLHFWGVMSLATLLGAVLSYPVNWWLVKNNLKHGMGTERALGKGGAKVLSAQGYVQVDPSSTIQQGLKVSTMEITATTFQPHSIGPRESHRMMAMKMPESKVSTGRKWLVSLISLLMLALGFGLASRYGDLSMRAGEHLQMRPAKMDASMPM